MKDETNNQSLETGLRQFYKAEYSEVRTPASLWEQLSKELDQPETPPAPLPYPIRNNSMRTSKEVAEQPELLPLPNQSPLSPEPRFNRARSRRVMILATLVATVVIMIGLVIVAGLGANNSNKTNPVPGGQVASPTKTLQPTPTIDLTALANRPTVVPTATPVPYTNPACGNFNSLDCVFKISNYSQVFEKNLGQNMDLSDSFNDYKVTVKRLYAGSDDSGSNNAIVIGYTINAPAYMSSLHSFHPESVVLKDEQGNIIKGIGGKDGEAQINEQGFVVYWQIPAGSQGKTLKLHLEISRILVLGPGAGVPPAGVTEAPVIVTTVTPSSNNQAPTPTLVPTPTAATANYLDHTFAFDLSVPIK